MDLDRLCIGKVLSTGVALERLLSTVHPLVLQQAATLRTPVVTLITLVRLLSAVNAFVSIVVPAGGKTFPTFTLEWLIINMFLLMHNK